MTDLDWRAIDRATEEAERRDPSWREGSDAALDRMRRAAQRGTGCHLTAEMIRSLGLTLVGQMWEEKEPSHD